MLAFARTLRISLQRREVKDHRYWSALSESGLFRIPQPCIRDRTNGASMSAFPYIVD
jgi:hypothetical protein